MIIKINKLIIGMLAPITLVACASIFNKNNETAIANSDLRPENVPGDIYALMAQEYLKVGMPEVALHKLERGLSIYPNNAQIHAEFGIIYQHLGDMVKAERYYRRALTIEPNNPFFRNAWGSFLCQQGKYELADNEFRIALGNPLYNEPWSAQTNAGVCALRAGNLTAGETYLQLAINKNPNIPLALLKLSELRVNQSRYTEAKTYLDQYVKLAPLSPNVILLQYRTALGLH
ncbi:hypothetical protein TI04_09690, partial [Achromatium sp. WMS2]